LAEADLERFEIGKRVAVVQARRGAMRSNSRIRMPPNSHDMPMTGKARMGSSRYALMNLIRSAR
jgi:hypothetical protein